MRRLSLNARLAQDAPASSDIHAVLLEITHPQLSEPIRLSTDNTHRVSDEPLVYGTRSNWRGADPAVEPYLWVIASALLPSDLEDAPAASTIILENLDSAMTGLLRSFTDAASLSMAVVLASSPDLVEAEWTGLTLVTAEITAGEITLQFSREEIELEPFPLARLSRERFPGLHP